MIQHLKYETELMNTKKLLDQIEKFGIDISKQKEKLTLIIQQKKEIEPEKIKKEDIKNFYLLYQIQLELLEKYHTYCQRNKDSNQFKRPIDQKLEPLSNQEKPSQNLESKKYEYEKEITNLKKYKRTKLKQTIKKGTILTGYLSAFTALGVGSILFAKKIATHKEYYTLEETYHMSDNKITKKTHYERSIEETIERIEYTNWDSPNLFEPYYQRTIKVYDVSELEYETLKEYTLLDIDLINIEPISKTEKKFRLSDKDSSEENLTKIKKVTQSKKDYIRTLDISQFIFTLWTELEMMKMLYCYYLMKSYINNISPKTPIKDLKQEYNELIYYKKKLELIQKKMVLFDNNSEINFSNQKNLNEQKDNFKLKYLSKKETKRDSLYDK